MNEPQEKAIQKLKEALTSSLVLFDKNGNLIRENYETKCACCGYVLGNTEQDGFISRYITCPNCMYIQYVPNYKLVPPFWTYKIVDKEGNDVLDFDGKCRLFEGEKSAKEYMLYCKMDSDWRSQRVSYWGGAE